MIKKLSEFEVGDRGRVLNVLGEGKIRRRLFDMGVTPDAEIIVKKKAPLGDPLEVDIRGYSLTLRQLEVECVEMEYLGKSLSKKVIGEKRKSKLSEFFNKLRRK